MGRLAALLARHRSQRICSSLAPCPPAQSALARPFPTFRIVSSCIRSLSRGRTTTRPVGKNYADANVLYANNGDGTFSLVPDAGGLASATSGTDLGSIQSIADYDNDGFVDVAITGDDDAQHLYRNGGNGTFSVVMAAVGITPKPDGEGMATRQPINRKAIVGQSATFKVAVAGDPPLTFQWMKDRTDLPGATASTYFTPPTTLDDNGAKFTVVVSNPGGSVTSAVYPMKRDWRAIRLRRIVAKFQSRR